jgi:hypothetical protein
MTIANFKVGDKVTLIVPPDQDCFYGRCGVETGAIGVVHQVHAKETHDPPCLVIHWDDHPTYSERSGHTWWADPKEVERICTEWWDIWKA